MTLVIQSQNYQQKLFTKVLMIKQTDIFNETFFTKNPEHDSNSNNTLKRFPLNENKNFVPSKFGPKRQKNMENDTVCKKIIKSNC